ncbi:SARP family transcriptional regulator [Sphingomonas koreensis]|nr:SARP family transcriptional regulator [Sphingomonas koreensis]
MSNEQGKYRLSVWGAFRLIAPDGSRVTVSSKKAIALFGLLATSDDGERTRVWLQDKLWGSRELKQAQSSLRRELSTLRALLTEHGPPLIETSGRTVRLLLDHVEVDRGAGKAAEFLEGIDIPGEDAFEDWLREMRQADRPEPPGKNSGRTDDAYWPVRREQSSDRLLLSPPLLLLPIESGAYRDGERCFVGTALTQELTECLSRLRWLPVVAVDASLPAAMRDLPPAELAAGLGARYVMTGRLLSERGASVLSIALTEMPSARLVWAETLRLEAAPSFADLREAALKLVNLLAFGVDQSEQQRALAGPADGLAVTGLVWRARYHINQFSRDDMVLARHYLDRAMAIDPTASEVVILDAYQRIWSSWTRRARDADVIALRRLALAAMRADPTDARGPLMAGVVETWLGNTGLAVTHLARAIELNPSFAPAHAHYGAAHYLNGEPDKAIAPIRRALDLSPFDHHRFYVLGELAVSCLMTGALDDALAAAEEILAARPGYVLAHVVKVGALARQGALGEARRAKTELIAEKPALVEAMFEWMPYRDVKWIDFLRAGLDLARLPGEEGPALRSISG